MTTELEWKTKQLETYKARVIELQSAIDKTVTDANSLIAQMTGARDENKRLADELEKELKPPDNKDTQ